MWRHSVRSGRRTVWAGRVLWTPRAVSIETGSLVVPPSVPQSRLSAFVKNTSNTILTR